MPWKYRGGRPYWYASRRVGDRVVSEYRGGASLGQLDAERVAGDRAIREAERDLERHRREEREAEDREVREADQAARALATWALEASGWHRPNRGRWRKRRMGTQATEAAPAPAPKAPPPEAYPARRLDRLMERIAAGNTAASMGGKDKDFALKMEADIVAHVRELAGPPPINPAVRGLAVMAAVHFARWTWGIHAAGSKDISIRQGDHWGRQADRDGRAFARTVKLLEQLRRGVPDVLFQQFNTQVNVGGADGKPDE